PFETHRVDFCQFDLQPEVGRLLLQQGAEGVSCNPVGKARVVLDVLAVEHLAAGSEALHQQSVAAVPSSVEPGGESCGSATDDDEVIRSGHTRTSDRKKVAL